jgi:hypothetical protein
LFTPPSIHPHKEGRRRRRTKRKSYVPKESYRRTQFHIQIQAKPNPKIQQAKGKEREKSKQTKEKPTCSSHK